MGIDYEEFTIQYYSLKHGNVDRILKHYPKKVVMNITLQLNTYDAVKLADPLQEKLVTHGKCDDATITWEDVKYNDIVYRVFTYKRKTKFFNKQVIGFLDEIQLQNLQTKCKSYLYEYNTTIRQSIIAAMI